VTVRVSMYAGYYKSVFPRLRVSRRRGQAQSGVPVVA
jgi:hypothetical protein